MRKRQENDDIGTWRLVSRKKGEGKYVHPSKNQEDPSLMGESRRGKEGGESQYSRLSDVP